MTAQDILKTKKTFAKEMGMELLWMPPGCWSDEAVQKCRRLNVDFVHDVCPIGTLSMMAWQ